MAKRKKTDYGVTPEQFVEAWERSKTVEEAAEKLGMPPSIASARASGYRRIGVRLKHMPRRPKNAVDVQEMNRLIAKQK